MKPDIKKLRLDVNQNNLVEEWSGQATMMLHHATLLADARLAEDEARAALSVVVAELDANIRDDPEEYGLTKATETSVTNAIPGCEEHQAAVKVLNEARHAVRIYSGAVDALEHRKRTLTGMTDLWLRQYYADPQSPHQPKELKDAPAKTDKAKRTPRKARRRD